MNLVSRLMRTHPSTLKFINESIKKKEIKVGYKRDTNYRFRFVLLFRKFLFTLGALWTQHYFRHFIVTDRLPAPSFRFFIRIESMQCGISLHERYFCVIHEGREFFVTFPSCLVSSGKFYRYTMIMKLSFLRCIGVPLCPLWLAENRK